MGWYSVRDLEHGKTTWVYDLPSCDFTAMFSLLKKFASEHELEDCLVGIRDYSAYEAREDGMSAALSQLLAESGKKKASGKAAKPVPVKAEEGPCWVSSFSWQVHGCEKAKQIEYLFYDEGWPGSITVAKTPSVVCPTRIVFTCHDRNPRLGADFMELLENAEIPADATHPA